jgi:threonyl-tRNA synthetase
MSVRVLKQISVGSVRQFCSHTHSQGANHVASTSTATLELATKQQLYMLDPNSPGSVFFLPHGTRIFNKLLKFMKLQQEKQGFTEVITPLMYKKQLWETSGHWAKYSEDMFRVEGNDKSKFEESEKDDVYGLKPMNCPGHCIVFKRFNRSYKELPIRFSDWSSLHRNEASGALTGLTRVRRFHQDDGHIFCAHDQVGDEISKTIKLIKICYGVFGLDKFRMMLSTRPENYIGTIEDWNRAESELANVMDVELGKGAWSLREGDGAFYGPKIDILLTDQFGKEHQAATIQLDFQLPQRFELEYQNEKDGYDTPIMIHRAIFGSVERFMALLIDHYGGKWPFWLSPRQAIVIPINDTHKEYAINVVKKLSNEPEDFDSATKLSTNKFFVDLDDRSETIGFRTKDAISKGYNHIILVGDKEIETNLLAIRSRSDRKIEKLSVDEIADKFRILEDKFQ